MIVSRSRRRASTGTSSSRYREMPCMCADRPVLLVGSVPLTSRRRCSPKRERGSVRWPNGSPTVRLGSGRTGFLAGRGRSAGQRSDAWRYPAAAGGYEFQLYRLAGSPADVEFGSLGYADVALASYREFARARDGGVVPAGTRFQVSLPTPLAVVLSFFEPDAVAAAWPLYQSALLSELGRIADGIPHDDLAVQWDIAAEICFVLEDPDMACRCC